MSVNVPVPPPGGTVFWCERAVLPSGIADRVLIDCGPTGVMTSVLAGVAAPPGATRLAGVVFPGFANGHSHAFHRALRGRTHAGGGTFWTWRDAMYQLAGALDPTRYHQLARLVFAEMVLAGYVLVGEFHYLHHPLRGGRYADPNAMGAALIAAAAEAGIRLTLLDTCYLAGGLDESGYRPLAGTQTRFGDGDVEGWHDRVSTLLTSVNTTPSGTDRVPLNPDRGAPLNAPRGVPRTEGQHAPRVAAPAGQLSSRAEGVAAAVRVGAAVHSVRAVPAEALPRFASATSGLPVHVHLSEQPEENTACRAFHGCTPTQLLADTGLLGPATTAVHATHLSASDIDLLGAAGVTACLCPTTEGDLADGIGPARELADAGCPISLGSDQHAMIDPFGEARGLEYGERLRTGRRGRFAPGELLRGATEYGHRSLGWPNGGRIAPGAPADLVAVRTDTARVAGSRAEQLLLVAGPAEVDTVVVGGRPVVRDGVHQMFGTVGPALAELLEELWA